MKTWYMVGDYEIRTLKVERETDKMLVVVNIDGEGCYRKIHKSSLLGDSFPTWEEAHDALLDKQVYKIGALRARLEQAKGRLGQIKGMKKPEDA